MDIVKPSILPGFMELLPEDQILFNKIKGIIEKNFKLYAFAPLDTPVIEKTEVLLAKGGGETAKQIYNIESSTKDMSLRFDLTVPLARFVAEHYHELSFPFKRYHIAKVYRGERNQKGRYREFYQCDIDVIGDEKLDIRNDAEIPAIIYRIFKELKLDDVSFHINNRNILNGFLASLGVDSLVAVLRAVDKLSKIGQDKVLEILTDESIEKDKAEKILEFISINGSNRQILDSLKSLEIREENFVNGLSELETVYEYMLKFGVSEEAIKIDLSITRGLDYYTSTVYETFIKGYESIGSVCSGGRYDDLASNYTKKKLPGIGISIGLSRLFYQLKNADLIKIKAGSVADAIIYTMGDFDEQALSLAEILRKEGLKIQLMFEDMKFKKKMTYANNLKIPYVIIIGEDEVKENKYTVKNMESGEQALLEIDELLELLISGK